MAYICLGRPSVFIVNSIITAGTSLGVVLYMMMFIKISISLVEDLMVDLNIMADNGVSFILTQKVTYTLFMFCVGITVVIKKQIKELKFVSYIMFFGIISLITMFF